MHTRCVNDLFGYCKAEEPPYDEQPYPTDRGDHLLGGRCACDPSTCDDYLRFTEECPPPVKEKGWVK